jgi:1,4-alpha-glucan branching enzyme
MKSILMICPEFPPVVTGGGGYVYEYLARRFSKTNKVRVIAANYLASSVAEPRSDGVRVTFINLLRSFGNAPELWTRMPPGIKSSFRLAALIREAPVDVAHLHGIGHPFIDLAAMILRRSKIPFVLTVHGFPGRNSSTAVSAVYRLYDKIFTTRLLRGASAVVAISHDLEVKLARRGVRATVIYNGIEVPTRKTQHVRDAWRFLCVGRLALDKGFEDAISAVLQLRREYPLIKLHLLGADFGAKARLMSLVPPDGSECIVFAGAVDRDRVLTEMQSARAVIIPSLDEPFGLVALEALAVGSAILAARAGALSEIVRDGEDGVLFAAGSRDGIAASIRLLLSDPALEKRIRESGPGRAAEFSTERAEVAYARVYDSVVSAGRL